MPALPWDLARFYSREDAGVTIEGPSLAPACQTHQLEGFAIARSCGFESPLPHHQLTAIPRFADAFTSA